MDLLQQDGISSALSKVLKEGIAFDLEYYDLISITKHCAKVINKEMIPRGFSVDIQDFVNLDVYYIKISKVLATINITDKGVFFPKGTRKEMLAGISPVIHALIEELSDLTNN